MICDRCHKNIVAFKLVDLARTFFYCTKCACEIATMIYERAKDNYPTGLVIEPIKKGGA